MTDGFAENNYYDHSKQYSIIGLWPLSLGEGLG
jgi:hypothetical protein